MTEDKSRITMTRECLKSRDCDRNNVVLVTPCLSQLPLHVSCSLGYAAAVLARKHNVTVIDLNAELHFKNKETLDPILETLNHSSLLSDGMFFDPFYEELDAQIDDHYAAVPWYEYDRAYITPPTWFPTVSTNSIVRLARVIKQRSPNTQIVFFGSSLGTWTNEVELERNGVRAAHLNDLLDEGAPAVPIMYDGLPTPLYENRDKYLFNLLPFMLKHGCPWARCRFCSLCKGANSGYLERAPDVVYMELQELVDRYDPAGLVCRDNALNGGNLMDFCHRLQALHKPWCGESRADLSQKEIGALSRSGCRVVFFGLESGSDRMLQVINKGITEKQMSDFVKMLHSNGTLPAPSLIVGIPGEEEADFEKTIQFVRDHRDYLEVVSVYPFMLTPASEFAAQRKQADDNVLIRLLRLTYTCQDLGLKVCLGEQSVEYFLFNWLCEGNQVA